MSKAPLLNEKQGHLHESGAGRSILIVNARARQGRENFRTALEELQRQNIDLIDAHAVRNPRFISGLVKNLLSHNKIDTVIVGGGDGTVSLLSDILAHQKINLGVIPMGTANDFARNLNLDTDIARSVKIIKDGYLLPIDLGFAGDRYFLNVASIGLGVKVAGNMNATVKKWLGPLAYLIAGVQAFKQMRPIRVKLTFKDRMDGGGFETIELKALQVAVANGRFYGGGLISAPNAALDNNKLTVTVIEKMGMLELVRMMPGLRSGNYVKHPKVQPFSTTEVRVETPRSLNVNMDGEICQKTPLEFKVAPGALKVFVPRP